MDWGVLGGLGQGLQQLGSSVFKAKVLDKLKEEEQVRAEQRAAHRDQRREEAEEARRLKRVKETRIDNVDGKFVRRRYNELGDQIGNDEPVSQLDIDRINREDAKERLSLEVLSTKNKLAEKELGSYDEERNLRNELLKAQIGSEHRQYTGTGRSTSGRSSLEYEVAPEKSAGELSSMLVKEFKDLEAYYTNEAKREEDEVLNPREFRLIADEVIKSAAATRSDPRTQFPKALDRYLQIKKNRKAGKLTPSK